jgi:hypothetical protein
MLSTTWTVGDHQVLISVVVEVEELGAEAHHAIARLREVELHWV